MLIYIRILIFAISCFVLFIDRVCIYLVFGCCFIDSSIYDRGVEALSVRPQLPLQIARASCLIGGHANMRTPRAPSTPLLPRKDTIGGGIFIGAPSQTF